jgi:cytochrome c oxidase subunit II
VRQALAISLLLPLLGACSRNPSVLLDHAGPHAGTIASLFWLFLGVSVAVWVIVLGFLAYALLRHRQTGDEESPLLTAADPGREQVLTRWVSGSVALTVAIITALVGSSYAIDRRLISLDQNATREIVLTAQQWWWEIRYVDPEPGKQFITANELHVPVGETIKLTLKSNDVIHSLWVPNVAGKRDIIPGQDNSLTIRVDRAGVWQGRCSEFCGFQHAFMGLALIALPPDEFDRWRVSQLSAAAQPNSDEEKRGQDVFKSSSCIMCHTIRGEEPAGYGSHAPDLTHLKSRRTIGAGAAPNTKGHLGGWIIDPHSMKPGVHMPVNLQNARDFQALLAYLEILR